MTEFVTVRRDALRDLINAYVLGRDHYPGAPKAIDDRLAAMIVSPWQPIETAPRDGTKILVFHPDMGVEITEWYEITQTNYVELEGGLYRKERAIFYAGWNNNGHHATHWQPLPDPPK